MPLANLLKSPKTQPPAVAQCHIPGPPPAFRVQAEVERPVIPINPRRLKIDQLDEDDIYDEMDRQDEDQISAELEAIGVHV